MREITRIIVHCSDTPASMDIGVDEIRKWHKEKGWSDIGYHFVIRRNGTIETGRPIEIPGAHVKGHNHDSIGICLIGGGGGKFDFTQCQFSSLTALIEVIDPFGKMTLHAHNEYSPKSCPAFSVKEWFRDKIQERL